MMNSLIRKLATVSSEDIDVRPLERKIIRINSDRLLKVIHHVGDAQAMEWMRQILEVAYDVEDWIDLCIHLHGRVRADQLERIEEFIVRIDNVEERLSSSNNEILPKIWVCGVGPWVVLDCWWSAGVGGGGVRGGYISTAERRLLGQKLHGQKGKLDDRDSRLEIEHMRPDPAFTKKIDPATREQAHWRISDGQ
ncbi:hypothetical protein OsJ_26591 [Oryza sativa Japonica Group]|uniref:Uncharacterized protein n=1 Tax=Oryza sativa subsp. japonica TaxID=39947 RepID=B9FZV1_ORYSJ|nr:hypothetical protein OsJ_26591 [Oryza sativa Japonica Group]